MSHCKLVSHRTVLPKRAGGGWSPSTHACEVRRSYDHLPEGPAYSAPGQQRASGGVERARGATGSRSLSSELSALVRDLRVSVSEAIAGEQLRMKDPMPGLAADAHRLSQDDLARFLIAAKHSMEKATASIVATLKWRISFGIDQMLRSDFSQHVRWGKM